MRPRPHITLQILKGARIGFNADFGRSAVDCDMLRDDQWERLKEFVPGGRKGKRGPRTDNRRFLNALLWMARSGGRWRDLPERLGDYETVKRRYYRWIEMGVLDAILAALSREADLEWLMIDSTIVRAHQQAAGACRQCDSYPHPTNRNHGDHFSMARRPQQ